MYSGPFKWWVQSVMPVVFDDSLSYYEVLAKLTKYIEGLTGDVEQIEKVLETIEGIGDVTEFTKFLETIQAEIGNLEDLQTPSKTNLVSAINEVALKADIAYWKPPTGIPESDLSEEVRNKLNKSSETAEYIINNKTLKKAPNNNSPADLGLGTYSVPEGGIPWDTLSKDVQDRIDAGGGGTGGTKDYTDLINKPQINGHTLNAGNNTAESLGVGTYSKPVLGIPENDLSAEVQEKLNTSGGIADSENSFVATRDYEAGELLYINGVLYKTKYKILRGTNLVPGNNIEETDISAEIERINSDINALQSGSGPDSWSLVTNVSCDNVNVPTRFFEYFNAIGRENYLFIVTPTATEQGAYDIDVVKRDGTVALHEQVRQGAQNQHRFTFTPSDTGEYYCTIKPFNAQYPVNNIRVELEYTESQGISELWNKVNEASDLEPRVDALENLVEEQQGKLDDLDDIPQRVETVEADIDELKDALPVASSGNVFLTKSDFVQGAYSRQSHAFVDNDYRITTAFIPVYKGTAIRFVPGTKIKELFYTFRNEDGVDDNSQTNWYNTNQRIIFTDNGFVNITLRSDASTTQIVPNDYDAFIMFMSGTEQLMETALGAALMPEWVIGNTGVDTHNSVATIMETSIKFQYLMRSAEAGDQYIVNTRGTNYCSAWAFLDSEMRVLTKSSNLYVASEIIEAPTGTSYIVVNDRDLTGKVFKLTRKVEVDNDFNLNRNLVSLHDMCWEYQNWVFPQCVSFNNYRHQLYFGFLTGDTPQNYTGVACYDFDLKTVTKTILKKNKAKDDHDLLAVKVLSNGYVICAYSDGHNDSNHIFVRKSTEKESIDTFNAPITLTFEYLTSYVQLFEYSGKLYLFTREVVDSANNLWRWAYKISNDLGETWGDENVLITADRQYYIQLTETNTAGTLMLLCYSNPSYDATDIRCGYLHLGNMTLYQSDNATVIGTNVDYHDINIMVSPSTGKKLRLYNGAKTNAGDIKFLYCEFTNTGSSSDGVYKVYDNGNNYNIVNAGKGLWIPKTQLGIAWIGINKFAVARESGGTDYLEIYDYDTSTGVSTLNEVVDSMPNSGNRRLARPMVDTVNNEALVYWKGYFNPNNYVDFFTDGRIKLLS